MHPQCELVPMFTCALIYLSVSYRSTDEVDESHHHVLSCFYTYEPTYIPKQCFSYVQSTSRGRAGAEAAGKDPDTRVRERPASGEDPDSVTVTVTVIPASGEDPDTRVKVRGIDRSVCLHVPHAA